MQHETEIHQGVGLLWHEEDGWHWETVNGESGGPITGKNSRTVARQRMECAWATAAKHRADVHWHKRPVDPVSHADFVAQCDVLRRQWR